MTDRTTRAWVYLFASLAAISTIIGVVMSFELREVQDAYYAELKRSSALAAQLQEATATRNVEQDEEKDSDNDGETAVAAIKTLAVRNNNPLNIKTVKGRQWFGQIAVDKHGHAVFDTPEHGIRAGANVCSITTLATAWTR